MTLSLCNSLKGGCSREGISLFSQVTSDRTRECCLKLCPEIFRLGISKNFFSERLGRHSNRGVLESLTLEVSETT